MTNLIDQKTLEAGIRQGRIERARAMRAMVRSIGQGLRGSARMLIGIFA